MQKWNFFIWLLIYVSASNESEGDFCVLVVGDAHHWSPCLVAQTTTTKFKCHSPQLGIRVKVSHRSPYVFLYPISYPKITTAIAIVYRLVCDKNSLHLQCSRETVRVTCPAGNDSLQELLGEWVRAFGATICQW